MKAIFLYIKCHASILQSYTSPLNWWGVIDCLINTQNHEAFTLLPVHRIELNPRKLHQTK